MAKEDPADSKRLRQFRKLFNDYTNGTARKSAGRRPSSASPNSGAGGPAESPVSTPQRRSVARAPRVGRAKKTGSDTSINRDANRDASPSSATPEKKKDGDDEGKAVPAEAKELAKADDEEFENVVDGGNIAKCSMKKRELQWKEGGTTPEKKPQTDVGVEAKKDDKKEDAGEMGVRRRKSRASPVVKRGTQRSRPRRKETAGGSSSSSTNLSTASSGSPSISPAPAYPSAESCLDDTPPPPPNLDKGMRARTKRTNGPTADSSNVRSRSPSAESCNELTTDLQEIDQNSASFKAAIKLMEILKRNNLLENALFPAQNEMLKAFFEGGMRNPNDKILGLISKAMDFVLDAVFYRGEELDCMIDNDLKQFIIDRTKSKPILLDVIISRPEFLPQSWGGRTVVLRHAEEPKK